jgi:hypothetical protein
MFYQDLSNYQYNLAFELEKVKNIGWLEKPHPFNEGSVDVAFLKKLFQIIKHKEFNIYRGVQSCYFCMHDGFIYGVLENEDIFLGHGEIWVPSITQDSIYASPTLMYHYIEKHHYLPPQDYIDSVMAFDLNSDWDGEKVLKKFVSEQ